MMRAAVLACAVVALAGCGSPPPPEPPMAAPAMVQVSPVKVLPPNGNVTGTYPAHCTASGKLPDPGCTPGSVSSAVTQADIKATICTLHYTSRPGIRAPESQTGKLKPTAMRAYGQPAGQIHTTELDHLVPLELGGSNDVSNLWPEPSDLPGEGYKNTKDGVESKLHNAVCAGKVTLGRAQALIASDWTTALADAGVG